MFYFCRHMRGMPIVYIYSKDLKSIHHHLMQQLHS